MEFTLDGALPAPVDGLSHFPKGKPRGKESDGVFKLNAFQKVR